MSRFREAELRGMRPRAMAARPFRLRVEDFAGGLKPVPGRRGDFDSGAGGLYAYRRFRSLFRLEEVLPRAVDKS